MEDGNTLLRAEQKCIQGMARIDQKLKRDGDLVWDVCDGTLSTFEACLMLPIHRLFVACDMDPYFVMRALPLLMLVFTI